MAVVANRNFAPTKPIDFASIESALGDATVTQINTATSYALLKGIAHYWPRFLDSSMPNASQAVAQFVSAVRDALEQDNRLFIDVQDHHPREPIPGNYPMGW
jgi:hypothetical protein